VNPSKFAFFSWDCFMGATTESLATSFVKQESKFCTSVSDPTWG